MRLGCALVLIVFLLLLPAIMVPERRRKSRSKPWGLDE